jgi:hypothetical protein
VAVQNILHVLDGRRPLSLVNPDVWDTRRNKAR